LKTLNPERLVAAAEANPKGNKVINVRLRWQQGKDHSYNFVKLFWKDHFQFHQRVLFFASQGV